jgi:hypothetical protein
VLATSSCGEGKMSVFSFLFFSIINYRASVCAYSPAPLLSVSFTLFIFYLLKKKKKEEIFFPAFITIFFFLPPPFFSFRIFRSWCPLILAGASLDECEAAAVAIKAARVGLVSPQLHT